MAPEERPRGITIGFYTPANEKANVKPVRPMSINSGIDVAPEERPRGITIGFYALANKNSHLEPMKPYSIAELERIHPEQIDVAPEEHPPQSSPY